MAESFDVYSDTFTVTTTPWGASLSFQLRPPHPIPQSDQEPFEQSTQLGTVRMSNEHLKVMVYMIARQVRRQEIDTGVQFEIPQSVLEQLGIQSVDWNTFWTSTGD